MSTQIPFFQPTEIPNCQSGTETTTRTSPEIKTGIPIHLRRIVSSAYTNGITSLAGEDRPNPRLISNLVSSGSVLIPNPFNASDMFWQWGQFIDHSIDLTENRDPEEPANIAVPIGDPWFDPLSTGTVEIIFNRSNHDFNTGYPGVPREQVNQITAYLDGSSIYGSDEETTLELRELDGSGKLKTSSGNLLPIDNEGMFMSGDIRVNEQVALTSMHTLFMREHNRLADEIKLEDPDLTGDQIFEKSQKIVASLMQVITYNEFLPLLLGSGAIAPYSGYRSDVDARITNIFSTACYRFGHSLLSSTLLRLDSNNDEIIEGNLNLRNAFFNPNLIINEGGIEPLLRGLAAQKCQKLDPFLVDDVRNFLFGEPGAGGFDLAALNIQRGRDHGLPDYNTARVELGLGAISSFAEITSDVEIQNRLAAAYPNINQIDIWVGGLAEDPVSGAQVGPLIYKVIKDQFEALRDGYKYWYGRIYSPSFISELENTTLADIIRRNTTIGNEISDNVFRVV